jgi:hypothetical protein
MNKAIEVGTVSAKPAQLEARFNVRYTTTRVEVHLADFLVKRSNK